MSKELLSLADRIKSLREGAGLTQAEIARALGISRSGVNAWEMGLSVPSTQYIVELAKQFNVSTLPTRHGKHFHHIHCRSLAETSGSSSGNH